MSTRPFSRPRTRVYDANYNIGESYYKSALDRLDRKYSGRPATPPRHSSIPKDILERHERAFVDEDLGTSRRRAEKHITEPTILDGIGSTRAADRALELLEGDLDEETALKLRRIRASKKQSVIDDLDLENMCSSITARRIKERSDKWLDAVGVTEGAPRKSLDDEFVMKRRSLKVSYEDSGDNKEMTKWTPLKEEDSGAALRARISRARLEELEDESNALVERQQARERRAAKLRSILAESSDDNAAAVQSVRISARKEKRTVEY